MRVKKSFDIETEDDYNLTRLSRFIKNQVFGGSMTRWPLQDAKNQFSEVVNKAIEDGPQLVTKHGEEAVVVISIDEYRKLIEPETSLVEFFLKSPLAKTGLDLNRDKDAGRKIDL